MRRRAALALACLAGQARAQAGVLHLTIDTGSMVPAEAIAGALKARSIRANFFLANEPTLAGQPRALDPAFAAFWRARAAEGHSFGTHTWRHWTLSEDLVDGRIRYRAPGWIAALGGGGTEERLDRAGFAAELARPAEAFEAMTGKKLGRLWRAPGGRTTKRSLEWAGAQGLQHIGWTDAGFLGDELDSERYPNRVLLERALARIRGGDVLLLHLGTRSRKEPFVQVVEPLLDGLLAKGFRFALLDEGVRT